MIQFLAQWNGYEADAVYSLDSAEESRLVAAGLARYFSAGMDGTSTSGAVFSTAAAFQAALDAAAAQASVVEITAGITLHANTTYWVSMASAPDSDAHVFVNFQEARKQHSATIMRGSYSEVGDGGRAGQVLWAYDSAQSRLYVRGITAVTHIAVVRYTKVVLAEGSQPGPVVVPSGVHLIGQGMDKSTILAIQSIDASVEGWPSSYAAKVRPFCKAEDLTTFNIGNFADGETLICTSVLYPLDSNADSVILRRVRTHNMAQNTGIARQNSIELGCNFLEDGKEGRGLQWDECEFYAARSGIAVETTSFLFRGWGVFNRCKTYGHNWLDGALNSFDHIHCTDSNMLPSGEVVTLGSITTYQGAILSGSLAPYTGRSHVLRYIGSNLTFVRPAGAAPLAMMVGDDTGEIIFDGCTVQCDMTPMIANDPIGAKTALTHAKLAQFIVRRSSLPMFRVQSLAGTTRLPMGIRVQTTTPVNSSAGTASLAGWIVDNSKELNVDWEFTASFTGSFAANANNKRLVLQAGPVGALVDVLDMTSIAANAGNWEIQITASRLGNIDGSFAAHKYRITAGLISTNATVVPKQAIVSSTVAAATNLQFALSATGVAAADIVLNLINVDGSN